MTRPAIHAKPICVVCGRSMLTNYRQRKYCTSPACQRVLNARRAVSRAKFKQWPNEVRP